MPVRAAQGTPWLGEPLGIPRESPQSGYRRDSHVTSRRRSAFLRECAAWVVVALVLSWVLRTFVLQVFYIPSSSMEQTLAIGDKVAVNLLAPGPFDLHRGDIVVFVDPGGWLPPKDTSSGSSVVATVRNAIGSFIGVNDEGNHLIKRIIGLPGDTVQCCTAEGLLTVNGEAIDEPYLNPAERPDPQEFTAEVPADHVWVMGDNRNHSEDSRAHQVYNDDDEIDPTSGSLPMKNIVGIAFMILWPGDRFTTLRNPGSTFQDVPDPPSPGASP